MNRPYIICHMASTVDGKIIADNWGESYERFGGIFERCHQSFNSQAWMVGRVTMEKDFTEGLKPELSRPGRSIERTPFIADKDATSFAIAADPKGKLGWDRQEIEGDHIIELLTTSVSDEYLDYLQRKGISYLLAGEDGIDFEVALEQLHRLFGIKTLMLEGGGNINGSLLNLGLIDELSLLVLPLADGTPHTATVFEITQGMKKKGATEMKLADVQRLEEDVLWLKYIINRDPIGKQ